MPGLLRGIARTAVVAGTASAVSGRVQRRQARKFDAPEAPAAPAYEQPAPAPVPAAPSTSDTLQQLKTLADLRAQGVLTDGEFAAEKAKILGG
jgi:hypothetical protein